MHVTISPRSIITSGPMLLGGGLVHQPVDSRFLDSHQPVVVHPQGSQKSVHAPYRSLFAAFQPLAWCNAVALSSSQNLFKGGINDPA